MSAGVVASHYVAGAGALTKTSMLAVAETLATESATPAPTQGGALTLGANAVGQYDYVVKDGPVTISAFNEPDWFTSREDIASAFVIVKGNLTINAGQTLRPAKRKLFTVVYVQGDLVVNGSISMTARGANHSGEATYSGGYTAPVALQINDVLTIPAAGGAGGAGVRGDSVSGPPGGAGANGGSGGGGGGGLRYGQSYGTATDGFGGRGAAGTCFSGGGGGGGARPVGRPWSDAGINGGHGGPGRGDGFGNFNMGSGAGNPGIAGQYSLKGNDGAGGTLIVICTGTLSGTGTIISAGVDGTLSSSTSIESGAGGGGSGGGSVTVLRAIAGASVPTASAPGGVAPTSSYQVNGGNGGAGSVRTDVPKPPVIVGTRQSGGGVIGGLNVMFPVGTQAGDLVVVQNGVSAGFNIPAGWTGTKSDPGGWFRGSSFWKVVTAGEVTTGYVTVTASTGDGHAAVATTVRNATTAEIVYGVAVGNPGDAAEPVAVPAGAGQLLYAAFVRNWSTAATIDRGTLSQTLSGGYVNGQHKTEAAGGAVTVNFAATGTLEGTYYSVVRAT